MPDGCWISCQDEVSLVNRAFFESQSYTGVADDDGQIVGLYILHPNNVGRCGHICIASYAVNYQFVEMLPPKALYIVSSRYSRAVQQSTRRPITQKAVTRELLSELSGSLWLLHCRSRI